MTYERFTIEYMKENGIIEIPKDIVLKKDVDWLMETIFEVSQEGRPTILAFLDWETKKELWEIDEVTSYAAKCLTTLEQALKERGFTGGGIDLGELLNLHPKSASLLEKLYRVGIGEWTAADVFRHNMRAGTDAYEDPFADPDHPKRRK